MYEVIGVGINLSLRPHFQFLTHHFFVASTVMYLPGENDAVDGDEYREKPAFSDAVCPPGNAFTVPFILLLLERLSPWIWSSTFCLTSSRRPNVPDGSCAEELFMLLSPSVWFARTETDWWAPGIPWARSSQLSTGWGPLSHPLSATTSIYKILCNK